MLLPAGETLRARYVLFLAPSGAGATSQLRCLENDSVPNELHALNYPNITRQVTTSHAFPFALL